MAFISPFVSTITPCKRSSTSSCRLRETSFTPATSIFRVHPQWQPLSSTPRMARTERTFVAVKPDGMNRGILGNIITRFESKGYKLVAIKTLVPSRQLAEEHYDALRDKKFFKPLVDFITSGPVCAMVWEGQKVVLTARKMIGQTNPLDSEPGTIRGDFAVDVGRNVIHGSDAVETAEREIALWFKENELATWEPTAAQWIYE